VTKALVYDERRGSFSVGSHIRQGSPHQFSYIFLAGVKGRGSFWSAPAEGQIWLSSCSGAWYTHKTSSYKLTGRPVTTKPPVTGRSVTGRLVIWTFGNWTFDNWTFGNWTFGNWTFCNWTFRNWRFRNGTFCGWPRVVDPILNRIPHWKSEFTPITAIKRIGRNFEYFDIESKIHSDSYFICTRSTGTVSFFI
jgi:hypothetical protein